MQTEQAPVVTISGLGDLRGSTICKKTNVPVARFLGVPYASVRKRWQAPGPPSPWNGIRDDPKELPRCPQLGPIGRTFKGHIMVDAEECLVLNVWTPLDALPSSTDCASAFQPDRSSARVQNLRPVMVYIHGGGGKFHSAHNPAESGLLLAGNHELCCFHINYRLGILGFLAHPELSAEDEQSDDSRTLAGSGNYALLDQIEALRWIKQYAHHFGGDSSRVTIWGLSSGAQYVSCLLVSPAASGLFHRAMIQSAVDLSNVRALHSSCAIWHDKSAEDWGCELGETMGCSPGPGQITAMRALPVEAIVRHSNARAATDCYEPAIDRRTIKGFIPTRPMSSLEALSATHVSRVPVMLGFTNHDGLGKEELEHIMLSPESSTSMDFLTALFQREFGSKSEEALNLYTQERPLPERKKVDGILAAFSKDLWYSAATVHMANLLASSKACPVFLYRFNGLRRSEHGFDSTFWRGSEPGKLSRVMATYLANFVKNGDPNADGLEHWKAHSAGNMFMELGNPQVGMQEFDSSFQDRVSFLVAEYFGARLPTLIHNGDNESQNYDYSAKRQRTV
eukprot:TRINITY_DN72392_c0_g1_i1.p1 TRINITY_DN72392_c0_g1~~TRINITY_DN72392_c0_g1_i1.p1  ORF type:complete len:566 (+),score=37.64 TRINITY_DN72392_c0_g1_i1:107-1804(+)